MVATAGAGVAAIGHEFFGTQVGVVGRVIQKLGVLHQLGPVVGGVDVDFNHARVGGDLQHLQACITRGRVAFQNHAHAQLLRGGFNGGHQV